MPMGYMGMESTQPNNQSYNQMYWGSSYRPKQNLPQFNQTFNYDVEEAMNKFLPLAQQYTTQVYGDMFGAKAPPAGYGDSTTAGRMAATGAGNVMNMLQQMLPMDYQSAYQNYQAKLNNYLQQIQNQQYMNDYWQKMYGQSGGGGYGVQANPPDAFNNFFNYGQQPAGQQPVQSTGATPKPYTGGGGGSSYALPPKVYGAWKNYTGLGETSSSPYSGLWGSLGGMR